MPASSPGDRLTFRACHLCEALCGLEIRTRGDAVAGVRGDAADPFSRGHLCPKAVALIDLHHDPDRLRGPVRRAGDRWEPLGWDEAFALVGERFAAIQREHGPDALGVYLGNPNVHHLGGMLHAPPLVRLLRTRNRFSATSVDQLPHHVAAHAMYGHMFLLPVPDIDRTAYWLVLGANPVASNGSMMTAPGVADRLAAIRARGGQVVVVDPRRTETAKAASRHLFIRPGTDAAFLLALVNALLEAGPPRTQRYGDRLAGLSQALAAIRPFGVERACAPTGIAPAEVRAIAAGMRAAPSAVAYGRMGVSVQPFGTVCQWLIQLVNLLTGNLDAEGGALLTRPAVAMTGPGTRPGGPGRFASRVSGLASFGGELPVAAMAEEIETPGAGQVRALLTLAGNPVSSTPNGRRVDRALASLDFMAAIDPYVNETTRHAHVILPPAPALAHGHYDIVFNALAVRDVARWNPPAVDKGEDERFDWELANALGLAYAKAAGIAFAPLPEPSRVLESLLGAGPRRESVTMAALRAAPHGLDLGALEPSLLGRLETPDGRIQCGPAPFLADLARVGSVLLAGAGEDGALLLFGRRHLRSNNSWMHNAHRLVKGPRRDQLWLHPGDALERGIAEGDIVRLASRTGEVRVSVHLTEDVMRGCACLPHGFGQGRPGVRLSVASRVEGASYNDVSDEAALDTLSGNAALNALPVTVTREHAP